MYTDLVVPDCIDNDWLSTAFDNLNHFAECATGSARQFTCIQVGGSGTGSVNGETCITIQPQSDRFNESTAELVEKRLHWTYGSETNYTISDSDNVSPGDVSRSVSAVIRCNGEIVAGSAGFSISSPIIITPFQCLEGALIELCFISTATTPKIPVVNGTTTFTFCGSMTCIKEVQDIISANLFIPPFHECGSYGRDAIHFLRKALTSLSDIFANFGQVASCNTISFDDDEEHTLLSNVASTTEYLILGSATVCASNNTNIPIVISAFPRVTCENEETICLFKRSSIGPSQDGEPPQSGCVVSPVIACGVCPPGGSLVAGLTPRVDCGEEPAQIVSVSSTLTSVKQEYCIFAFERASNAIEGSFAEGLGRCIETRDIEELVAAMRAINDACESQRPVNIDAIEESGQNGGDGSSFVIRPPTTWNPADGPAPVKKWYVSGTAAACFSQFPVGQNEEQVRYALGRFTVYCGADALFLGQVRWQYSGSGRRQLCGFPMNFSGCRECPIDEEIRIEFESLLPPNPIDNFTFSIKMFCY